MSPESQLTISRTNPDDVQQRQVIVDLDGEPFDILMFGQSATRSIAPGPHRLLVNNTWNKKTVEFEASPGEHVKFSTVNRAGRLTWFLVALIGAGPMYVSIEREM